MVFQEVKSPNLYAPLGMLGGTGCRPFGSRARFSLNSRAFVWCGLGGKPEAAALAFDDLILLD